MLIKFVLGFMLLFFAVADGWAADYWVYVRLEDRSGVSASDDVGRSKRGDVVDVRLVDAKNDPSEVEKKEYKIIKVTLSKAQRDSMLELWTEPNGTDNPTTKAYRKNKIDLTEFDDKKGLTEIKVDPSKIKLSAKTNDDLVRYEFKRKIYLVKRPFIRLANIITRKAFAETISTINKSGQDYDSLTLWEDAKDGDLVTETSLELVDFKEHGLNLVCKNKKECEQNITAESTEMKLSVDEDRKSTRLNSSHIPLSRMPSSA